MNIISALNIEKRFSNHLALHNVTVKVPEGSIYGILGPNGAGKTTLLRIINNITAPDRGEIHFYDKKLKSSDIQQIGYLPEERGLYKKMKVGEQALYLARIRGLSKSEALSKLKYWFEKFGIQTWWNKKIEELSKGMQQKIQFIITILHNPKLLIFDEPFTGFDPINTNILKKEILELRDKGASIIFSTHNMESVEELCDHITLIDKSEVILEGDISKLRQKFKSNIFEVGLYGDTHKIEPTIDSHFDIKGSRQENEIHFVKLAAKKTIKHNEVLKLLMPAFEIHSFKEVLPSMNEIFIKAVNQSSKSKN